MEVNMLVRKKVNEYIYYYEKSNNKFIRFCNITFFVIKYIYEYAKCFYTYSELELINNGIREYRISLKK